MKPKLKIYWIEALNIWPVGDAGAVVIAESPEKALKMVEELKEPQKPEFLGYAKSTEKKPRVIISNNTEY